MNEPQCNGRCHEAGERGVYFDIDCPKHVREPMRAWLDADDCPDCGGTGCATTYDGQDLGECRTCDGSGISA